MKDIYTSNAPEPVGPYSQAIVVDGTIYISGQIPINPESGKLIEGTIEDATHQVMKNIKAILEEAGSSLDKIIKCSIFVKDLSDFGKINEVYGSYLSAPFPARETVEVSKLPLNATVEISAIAKI